MQALVLAGGEGTRLRPLTLSVPKPVMPLAGRPFLTFMLDWLERHGVEEAILSCGFLSDAVERVLGERYSGITLRYVVEEEPLGTAGPVRLAADMGLVGERLLVLNGDPEVDQPTVKAGAGAVWATWDEAGTIMASGAPVSGLGSIGAFSRPEPPHSATGCNCADADSAAFLGWVGQLVHSHRRELAGVARAEGLTAEEAFDAVQDAFHRFLTLPAAHPLIDAGDESRRLLITLTRNVGCRNCMGAVCRFEATSLPWTKTETPSRMAWLSPRFLSSSGALAL